MRKLLLVAGLVLILSLAASAVLAQESVTVTLGPGRDSSEQTGTATLTATGDQTEVVISVNTGPAGAGVEQPSHIHEGQCPGVGGVAFPLTNTLDGQSTTVVDAKLSDLTTGAFSLNLHKSKDEVAVYTSCGNIPAAAALPTTGGSRSLPVGWLIAAGAVVLLGGIALSRRSRSA